MLNLASWHETTIQQLTTLLQPHPDVHALLVVGSRAANTTDQWSDLDVIVVVADTCLDMFFPSVAWLTPLGALFAYEQFPAHNRGTTRACFIDGRRIDFLIATESSFAYNSDWPLWDGVQVLFSCSDAVLLRTAHVHPRPPIHSVTDEQFATLVHQFWFRAVIAMVKVIRNDVLIGLHLCLECIQDVCVLAMLLRDRTEGTTIHKTGGIGNLLIQELHLPPTPPTARTLLDSLAQTGNAFDRLAVQWQPAYQPRYDLFAVWLEHAGRTVAANSF